MKEFCFLAGMPRSGSTVLATLLSQHPELHTSPTSTLRSLLRSVQSFYLGESLYFDRDCEQQLNIQRGILQGFYQHVPEKCVLEKDRSWAADCPLIEAVTGERPRIVATTRRISEVIASFSLLADRVGKQNKMDDELHLANRPVNQWSRSRILWEKYVYASWRDFKRGYENNPDCFHLVDYGYLVGNPLNAVRGVYNFFGLDPVTTVTKGLVNPSPENDLIYGIKGLHDVRSKLERTSPPPEEVLGKDVCEFWDEKRLEFWALGKTGY